MKGLRAQILLGLSTGAAIVCVATGIEYAPSSAHVGPPGLFLLTLASLGAFALFAAGFWQLRAGPRTRVFVIVILAFLAGGYTAANSLGLAIPPDTEFVTPRSLHWTGLAVGSAVYVASIVEVVFAIRAREESGDG